MITQIMLTSNQTENKLNMHWQNPVPGFEARLEKAKIGQYFHWFFYVCQKILVRRFFCIEPFMADTLGSIRACRLLFPVFEPNVSAARCFEASGGGLKALEKELAMQQHSLTQKQTNFVSLDSQFSVKSSNKKP